MSGVEESQHAKPILEDVDIVAIPRNYDTSDLAWLHKPSPPDDVLPKKGKSRRRDLKATGAVEAVDLKESKISTRELEAEQKKKNTTTTNQKPNKANVSLVGMKTSPDNTSPMKPQKLVHWLKDEEMLRVTFKFSRILLLRRTDSLSMQRSPSIDEVASYLLGLLSESRQTCRERPIVFIGHEIGVMVIEKALMLSSKGNEAEAQVFRITAGIVFLSSMISGTESDAEQELDYLNPTSRMFSDGENFRFRGFNDTEYVGPRLQISKAVRHLEELKATLEEAEKSALKEGDGPVSHEVNAGPSAISLARYHYLGKIKKAEDAVYLNIINAIASSLECYQLLSMACKGKIQDLRSIIDFGVGVNLQDRTGNTALHLAALNGRTDTVKVLLHDFGANVALQNSKSRSALFLAVDSGKNNVDIVTLLLKNGARVKDQDKSRQSPLSVSKNPRVSMEIKSLLKNPPLVEGPRDVMTIGTWRQRTAPNSARAEDACKSFRAVLVEFFLSEGKESFVLEDPSVYHLLYKSRPERILEKARERARSAGPVDQATIMNQLKCRWYHIPANNVGTSCICPG